MVNVGLHINPLVFEVAELHKLHHGMPVPVLLNPLTDVSVSHAWSYEEIQDPGVKWEDEGLFVVVVIVVVSGIELSNMRGLVRLVLFQEVTDPLASCLTQ
jgi:hypothetical protein